MATDPFDQSQYPKIGYGQPDPAGSSFGRWRGWRIKGPKHPVTRSRLTPSGKPHIRLKAAK